MENECSIFGCYCDNPMWKTTPLCNEHQTDFSYWRAHKAERNPSKLTIQQYINEKNKELLG